MNTESTHAANGRLMKPAGRADLARPDDDAPPPLSPADAAALASFHARQRAIRDLTLGCAGGHHTGAYVYGPPGTDKTHTVLGALREAQAHWQYHQRITAKPLYLEMEKHPDAVFVIDDCEQLFAEKAAVTLLRSALGGEVVQGRRVRRVSYSVSGGRARVLEHFFWGALVFLANRPLADERPEVRAVASRIPCVGHAPPDAEVRALMRDAARRGHRSDAGAMSPRECVEVVEYLLGLASELGGRLDLRWLGHAYGHYLTQAVGGGASDWRDMVKFHVMQSVAHFDHTPRAAAGGATADAADRVRREAAVAAEIQALPGLTRDERLRLWEERTAADYPHRGLSRATYYRRLEAGRGGRTG